MMLRWVCSVSQPVHQSLEQRPTMEITTSFGATGFSFLLFSPNPSLPFFFFSCILLMLSKPFSQSHPACLFLLSNPRAPTLGWKRFHSRDLPHAASGKHQQTLRDETRCSTQSCLRGRIHHQRRRQFSPSHFVTGV